MSDASINNNFDNAHVAWLACLYAIAKKIRLEGLMSLEGDCNNPHDANSIFWCFPQTQVQPYLEFATDLMRMMVAGSLNPDEMKVYVEHYIGGMLANDGLSPNEVDESILCTIWLTLRATMGGYSPQVACEFGRQAVPWRLKPTATQLEEVLHEISANERWKGLPFSKGGLDAAAEGFVASLGKT